MRAENSKAKKLDRGTLKKVLRHVKRYRALLLVSVLLAAFTVALTLYVPILIGDAIDLIVEAGKVDLAGILPLLGQVLVTRISSPTDC